MPNFQQSLDYLYGLQKNGIKFGLNSTGIFLSGSATLRDFISFILPARTVRVHGGHPFPILCNHGSRPVSTLHLTWCVLQNAFA